MNSISLNSFSILSILAIVSVLFPCCSSIEVWKNISENSGINETTRSPKPAYIIKAERPYIWIDLMPGSKPKYYCTAEIFISCPEIEPELKTEIHSLTFIQGTTLIPVAVTSENFPEYIDSDGVYCVKVIMSTKEGFYHKDIIPDNNADLQLEVSINGNIIPYRIVNVAIEKVF